MRVKNNAVLGEFVYEKMKEMILTRQILCGEKIQEKTIEDTLKVSRTPVREAVRRLSNEGIVVLYPNRHAEVIRFTPDSIKELGIIRLTLDCLTAQLAILNGSNQDFYELEKIALSCGEIQKQNEIYSFLKCDCAFHTKLAELTRNKLLIDMQHSISLQSMLLQSDQMENCPMDLLDTSHQLHIVSALKERNTEKLLTVIQEYLCPLFGLDHTSISTLIFNF